MLNKPVTRPWVIATLHVSLLLAFGLSGCADHEPVDAEPVERAVQVDDGLEKPVQVVDGYEVYANRPDEFDPALIDMPDGIHLQPGVEIHKFPETIAGFVHFEEEAMELMVAKPVQHHFEPVQRGHVISAGDAFAFIVEGVEQHGEVLIVDVAPLQLERVVYGNWRIPFKLDMATVAEASERAQIVQDPTEEIVHDQDEVISTHRQQSLPATLVNISANYSVDLERGIPDPSPGKNSFSTDASVSGNVAIEGRVQLDANRVDGEFVGRIGSYRSHYDCGSSGWLGWIKDKFCVDEVGVRINMTSESELTVKGEISGRVEAELRRQFIDPVLFAPVPLGPTGLTINLEYSLKMRLTVGVSAGIGFEGKTSWSKTDDYGFNWNRRRGGEGQDEGSFLTYPRGNASRDASPFEWSVEGNLGTVEGALAVVNQIDLGVGVGGSGPRARGAAVQAVLGFEFKYAPAGLTGQREGEHNCWKAEVFLKGVALPKLEFAFGPSWYQKRFTLFCDNDDPAKANCAELSTPKLIFGSWKGDDYCADVYFDTLVLDVASTTSPIGFEDIEDLYDVVAICKERVLPRNPRAGRRDAETRKVCVSGHGGKLAEVSDACPITTSDAIGLTAGRHEFSFGETILPNDIISVIREPRNANGCAPSGSAEAFLKRGDREVSLTEGVVDGTIRRSASD